MVVICLQFPIQVCWCDTVCHLGSCWAVVFCAVNFDLYDLYLERDLDSQDEPAVNI